MSRFWTSIEATSLQHHNVVENREFAFDFYPQFSDCNLFLFFLENCIPWLLIVCRYLEQAPLGVPTNNSDAIICMDNVYCGTL